MRSSVSPLGPCRRGRGGAWPAPARTRPPASGRAAPGTAVITMSARTRAGGRRVGTGSVARSSTGQRPPGARAGAAGAARAPAGRGAGRASPRRGAPRRRRRRPRRRRRGPTTRTAEGGRRHPGARARRRGGRARCRCRAGRRASRPRMRPPPTSASEPVQRVSGSPATVRSSHAGSTGAPPSAGTAGSRSPHDQRTTPGWEASGQSGGLVAQSLDGIGAGGGLDRHQGVAIEVNRDVHVHATKNADKHRSAIGVRVDQDWHARRPRRPVSRLTAIRARPSPWRTVRPSGAPGTTPAKM